MKAQKFADVLIIVGDVTVTDDGGKYKRALHLYLWQGGLNLSYLWV